MKRIYILTKQEFTSLYRFGRIPINLSKVISIEEVTNGSIENKIFNVFTTLPPFTGDEEYIIINFENGTNKDSSLEIENVKEIIPLTKAARYSYQMKFDPKIDFKEAQFENVIHKVEEYIDIQERFRGANVFWKLCDVKTDFKKIIPDEIIKTAYRKRTEGIKSNSFKEDFLIHLLVYERYDFFPNDSDLGFFYDVGEIFAHSKGKPTFKGSNFHSFLEKNKKELSQKPFIDLVTIISESNEIETFTKQLTSNNNKQFITAAIFLKFKEDLADRETIKGSDTGSLIGQIRKNSMFNNELNQAIYLTGAFFGYQKFYDDFYEIVGLNIFKKKEKPHKSKSDTQNLNKEIIESKSSNTAEEEREDDQEKEKQSETIQQSSDSVNSKNKRYDGIKKQIFESLQKILDEENGEFELKTDRLKQLQKELLPLSPDKEKLLKPNVAELIQDNFSDKIIIRPKGKTGYIIKRKIGDDLFSNTENITH